MLEFARFEKVVEREKPVQDVKDFVWLNLALPGDDGGDMDVGRPEIFP